MKYVEYIAICLSVFLACIFIGYVVREYFIINRADEFTINLFFWVGIGFGVLIFIFVILFLDPIVNWTIKRFSNYSKSKLVEKQEVGENEIQLINSAESLEILEENNVDTNAIRKIQHQKKVQQENEKLQIALNYTRNQFAFYVSDEDLDLLCNAVVSYSKKEKASNSKLIETTGLSNLDLYHFGWNIWNHFGGRSHLYQKEIATLLKFLFQKLVEENLSIDTIKSHLTDPDTKDTIIKLQEDLSDYK